MLSELYEKVLALSLSGTFAILFMIFLRFFLKSLPKTYLYPLWTVVFFRLLLPFTIESPHAVLPTSQSMSESVLESLPTQIQETPSPPLNFTPPQPQIVTTTENFQNPDFIPKINPFPVIWMTGIFCLFGLSLKSTLKLKKQLSISIPHENNIYFVDSLQTPFVWGLLKPKIYLPSDLDEKVTPFILAHEKAHIHRVDHISRGIAFLILAIHWFNPFVWLAFALSGKDMELSADEIALKKLKTEKEETEKQQYAQALLDFATTHKLVSPLGFSQGEVKERIVNVMKFEKKSRKFTVIATVVTGILGISMLLGTTSEKNTQVYEKLSDSPDCTVTSYDVESYVLYPDATESVLEIHRLHDINLAKPVTVMPSETIVIDASKMDGQSMELDEIHLNIHTISENETDFEYVVKNEVFRPADFSKGDPLIDKFLEIYNGLILDPIPYVYKPVTNLNSNEDPTSLILYNSFTSDHNFIYQGTYEAPIFWVSATLYSGDFIQNFQIFSNNIVAYTDWYMIKEDYDINADVYASYQLRETEIPFKDALYQFIQENPDSFPVIPSPFG